MGCFVGKTLSITICVCLLLIALTKAESRNDLNEIKRYKRQTQHPPPVQQHPVDTAQRQQQIPEHQHAVPLQHEAQHQQQVPQQQQQHQQQHQQVDQQQQHQQQEYHQRPAGQHVEAGNPNHLATHPTCAADVDKYCSKVKKDNDLAVLECLQDLGEDEVEILSGECEHLMWQFKKNLTQDQRFHQAASQFCRQELTQHLDCQNEQGKPGHLLSCLLEYKENMTHGQCRNFLSRTERIAFTDFRLVGGFVDKCTGDVEKFKCGSLVFSKDVNAADKVHHSQGSTLQCLIEKLIEHAGTAKHQDPQVAQDASLQLSPECRHEVLRLAELQSDDYHLDRPLFFGCRNDRDKFCQGIQAGEGRIYNCLLEHKEESEMSQDCREQLVIRAQLIAQDYKVSHTLVQSCQKNIQKYNCNPQADKDTPEHFYLSFIMLCLENAAHTTGQLEPACQEQLVEHRRLMMSDYRMSPEVVLSCSDDIRSHCGDTLEGGGRTLHCLMGVQSGTEHRRGHEHQGTDKTLQPQCFQALSQMIKAANPASDYRIDVALYRSCRSLIDGPCSHEANSESDVLSCLMNHVETKDMTMDCEDRLLEVQYFLSRDFALDPHLYKGCHKDAVKLCHATEEWHKPQETNQPELGPQVLACLYRHAYGDTEGAQLSRACKSQVIRTLRERAVSVHLMPEIEEVCRGALAAKCSQETKPGEEWKCLQENMEDDDFKKDYPECNEKLEEFTERESKDVRLNRALTAACRPVIERHCKELMDEEIDHGDVMECLQQNKGTHEMNSKCRAYVNFYTLVSLKDYKFSYKFKKMCSEDIQHYCKDIPTHDKTEVIRCLGEVMVNHQVLGTTNGLKKECKRQLRNDFLSMENAEPGSKSADGKEHMTSGFWKICKKDIQDTQCYQEGHISTHEVMECLKKKQLEEGIVLQKPCQKLLFGLERIEMADNRMDAQLMESCAIEIKQFCHDVDSAQLFKCLKKHLRQPGMGAECTGVVKRRKLEQGQDIRLRPGLLTACSKDLQHLCAEDYKNIMQQINQGAEEKMLEGHAVYCLRMQLTPKDPSKRPVINADCEQEVKAVILESEVDPRMDPVFYKLCKNDISKHCGPELFSATGHGTIMECMKTTYYSSRLQENACKKEMGRRTSEELSDIHLDPVLHEACALDIKHYCHDTPPGEGRLVGCLLMAADSTNAQLSNSCKAKLLDRKKLWDAAKGDDYYVPDNVAAFGQLIIDSPARNSLLTVFLIVVLVIFAGGLCFGRATKRVRAEIKNR